MIHVSVSSQGVWSAGFRPRRPLLLGVVVSVGGACSGSSVAVTDTASTGTAAVSTTSVDITGTNSATGTEPSVPTGTTGAPGLTGTSDTTGGDSIFLEPRWVLRDRDGVRVKALVEPRCGYTKDSKDRCLPLDFDSPNSFPCVRVVDHESRYINLAYDLVTGQIGPCNYDPTNPEVHISSSFSEQVGFYFLNDQCQGAAYAVTVGAGGSTFLYPRYVYYAEDDMWYVASEGCDETLKTPFWGTLGGNVCSGPSAGARMCPFKVIPDWVKELLPNPPYTLDVEYG